MLGRISQFTRSVTEKGKALTPRGVSKPPSLWSLTLTEATYNTAHSFLAACFEFLDRKMGEYTSANVFTNFLITSTRTSWNIQKARWRTQN